MYFIIFKKMPPPSICPVCYDRVLKRSEPLGPDATDDATVDATANYVEPVGNYVLKTCTNLLNELKQLSGANLVNALVDHNKPSTVYGNSFEIGNVLNCDCRTVIKNQFEIMTMTLQNKQHF